MTDFEDYLSEGWPLVRLRSGTKQPLSPGWSDLENAITHTGCETTNLQSAGLLLAYCTPPLMTLDIDAFHESDAFLTKHGIDLGELIQDRSAVQICSGRENRAKLVYSVSQIKTTCKYCINGKTILEFRCGTRDQKSVQDVLPPSIHPDTGDRYTWKGDWRHIPPIPKLLEGAWDSLLDNQFLPTTNCSVSSRDLIQIETTLATIDPDVDYQNWILIGQGLHNHWQGGAQGLALFQSWSQRGNKFKPGECEKKWRTFKSGKGVGIGTIFHLANANSSPKLSSSPLKNPFGIRNMSQVRVQEISWLWKNMLAKGKVHLLSGAGGRGKTTLMLRIAASVTNGEPFPDSEKHRTPSSVLYLSAEDGAEDTLLPRFLASKGDPSLFNMPERLIQEDGTYLSILDHSQILTKMAKELSASLIIFDPGTAFCGSNIDNNNATQIRSVMARLQDMADDSKTAVVVLNHMTKSSEQSPVNRVLGSGAWVHASRIVWGVAEEEDGTRVLGLLKSNLGPMDHVYPYHLKTREIEGVTAQFAKIGDRIPGEVFTNYSDFDGKTHGRKQTESEVYLRESLKRGPKKKEDLIAGTELPVKSLERAATDIGVVKERSSSTYGKAIWRLPDGR